MIARDILARLRKLPDQTVPTLRELRREISKALRSSDGGDVIKLSLDILGSRGTTSAGARMIAYELIASHRSAMNLLDEKVIERLGKGMASWSDVDMFAVFLAGPAWREGQIADAVIARWARSRDRWWRRAALVSTVGLNAKSRGGEGDARRTLAVCETLIADRDDMVVKAMSWALRELAKRDAAAVQRFVEKNESNLAPRVLREVRNKLRTGLKNPRRR